MVRRDSVRRHPRPPRENADERHEASRPRLGRPPERRAPRERNEREEQRSGVDRTLELRCERCRPEDGEQRERRPLVEDEPPPGADRGEREEDRERYVGVRGRRLVPDRRSEDERGKSRPKRERGGESTEQLGERCHEAGEEEPELEVEDLRVEAHEPKVDGLERGEEEGMLRGRRDGREVPRVEPVQQDDRPRFRRPHRPGVPRPKRLKPEIDGQQDEKRQDERNKPDHQLGRRTSRSAPDEVPTVGYEP